MTKSQCQIVDALRAIPDSRTININRYLRLPLKHAIQGLIGRIILCKVKFLLALLHGPVS
jgi:hypothetical protein